MINTYNLFAIPVFHGKLPVPVKIYNKILKYTDENCTDDNTKDTVSCVKGFQIHDEFDGKKELHIFLHNYLRNIYSFKPLNGWLNILGKGSYNKPHTHIGDEITHGGVLYLSNNNSNICFTREHEVFEITPKIFDYVIFPCALLHYVLPGDNNSKRISYAFNLKKE